MYAGGNILMVVQPDGKIVAVGISQALDNRDFTVVRYAADPTVIEQLDQLIALVTGLCRTTGARWLPRSAKPCRPSATIRC